MPHIPLHYVDLRTFCYATEDEKRVESALRTLLPDGFEIERAESEGHYGDRILVLSARVENADGIRTVLARLAAIEEGDRLVSELDERVTENTELFFRVDKQAAFQGEVAIGEGITVRAKVEAYPATKEAAVENAREVLEELEAESGEDHEEASG
ncbi:RNA-binding protein [Saliphagus sp. LR7]|uniref:RNA-binding protein n=1 Tax=Saliphagus sp. LR7 TaxID=2282654 RepID=UPI000DF7D305|nr:RNA-binding protein [Saliphagus sp. LR7]